MPSSGYAGWHLTPQNSRVTNAHTRQHYLNMLRIFLDSSFKEEYCTGNVIFLKLLQAFFKGMLHILQRIDIGKLVFLITTKERKSKREMQTGEKHRDKSGQLENRQALTRYGSERLSNSDSQGWDAGVSLWNFQNIKFLLHMQTQLRATKTGYSIEPDTFRYIIMQEWTQIIAHFGTARHWKVIANGVSFFTFELIFRK